MRAYVSIAAVTALAAPAFMLAQPALAQGAPQTVQLAKLDVAMIATGYAPAR